MSTLKVKGTAEGETVQSPLRVEVLDVKEVRKYKNDKQINMQVLEGTFGDHTSIRPFKAYSPIAYPYLKVGNTLMLINFVAKQDEIILRQSTKVARIPKLLIPIPESVRNSTIKEVEELEVIKIKDVENGQIFSTKLKILQVTESCLPI